MLTVGVKGTSKWSKKYIGQGSAQELPAGIQSTILVQIAGEGDTKAAATFFECSQHDADTPVGIQAKHGDCAVEGVQRSSAGQGPSTSISTLSAGLDSSV